MSNDRAQQVARLFDEVVELPSERRAVFLDKACAGDDALRKEVNSLLRHDDQAGIFLETPAAEAAAELFTDSPATKAMPSAIGPYRIIDVLGEGGMAVVYLAEQEVPKRRVALKVIRSAFAGPSMLHRFEQEADVLARLQHPGIAQVFEAGMANTEQGRQPYFAMELIRGRPITEYAEQNRLSSARRMGLMADVCEALHHAHQKGVIHRDLKPANILVADAGQPKILDFGIARLTDSDLRVTTLRTDIGQLIGTIPYMSPEQVSGQLEELDTRSDIYALGVVSYELLAGRLPYESPMNMIPDAIRAIREEDPPSLSTIDKVLRGDIETIVSKALEKDKDLRYQSAAAMAADIRRFLRDDPIIARPPSTVYRLRKFARRNRALVVGLATTFLVLVAGIVVSAGQARRARDEALRANEMADEAKAVTEYLKKIFSALDPHSSGREVNVAKLVDQATAEIETTFIDKPKVEATVRCEVGTIYLSLGLNSTAEAQFTRALQIRRRLFGDQHPETLKPMNDLGLVLYQQGRLDEAEPLLRSAVEGRRKRLGVDHPATLIAMNNLALVLHSKRDLGEAEALLRRALSHQRKVLGEHHLDTLASMINLANVLRDSRELEDAEALYRQALEGCLSTLSPDHRTTCLVMSNLAKTLKNQGKLAEAEAMYRDALDRLSRQLGDEHWDTLVVVYNLAKVLKLQKKHADAEAYFRSGLTHVRKTRGADHSMSYRWQRELVWTLRDQGKHSEAEPLSFEVLGGRRRLLGDTHRDTLVAMNDHAHLLLQLDRPQEAEVVFRQLVALGVQSLPEGHWPRTLHEHGYARCLLELQRYQQAERSLLQSFAGMKREFGLQNNRTTLVIGLLVKLYQAWNKPDEAAQYRALLVATKEAPRPPAEP